MLKNLTPERVINITRLSVLISYCWPPPSNATRMQVTVFKVIRTGALVSAVTIFLPLLYAAYCHSDNPINTVRSVSLSISVSQVFLQTLSSAVNYERIQQLIEEMTLFCKNAKEEEQEVLQKFIKKCSLFHGICIAWFYACGVVVMLATLETGDEIPPNVEYPFSVDYFPLNLFVFLHQFLVAMQIVAHVCMNVFCALLLWFSAARFEMLMEEFRAITDTSGLKACIIKYYEVKRFAKEAAAVVRLTAFITVLITTMTTILCGIALLSKKLAMSMKLQFVFVIALGLLEVFLCAWPADYLMGVSSETCQTAYKSTWYQQGLSFQKSLICALSPQVPVVVSVGCVMPTLSLSYYCSYLSNTFSAFTALRVMIGDEDEE